MKRAKLSQVVSAVFHLHNKKGVAVPDVADYLRHNYGLEILPDYKKALKLAVHEGFLTARKNRFFPASVVGPSVLAAARRRRSRGRKSRGNRRVYTVARRHRRKRGRRHDVDLEQLMARRRRRSSRRRHGRRRELDELLEAPRRRRRRGTRRGRRHENDEELQEAKRRRRRHPKGYRRSGTHARRRRRRRGKGRTLEEQCQKNNHEAEETGRVTDPPSNDAEASNQSAGVD